MRTVLPKNIVLNPKDLDLSKNIYSTESRCEEVVNLKVTRQTIFEEELPYCLKKKMFLFLPKLISYKLQYVRCWRVILDFKVTLLTKNNIRDGQVELVVDEIKGCSALEPGCKLSLNKKEVGKGLIFEGDLDKDKAIKKATIDARWKVVMGQYKRPPELKLVRCQEFLRPYYEAEVLFNNKVSTQWIAADGYDNYITYQ